MADASIDIKIEQVERDLAKVEAEHGPTHERVAEVLTEYAELLRSNKMRLLDAANMAARAQAIMTGDSRRDVSEITAKPTNAKLQNKTANRIKAAQTANRLRAAEFEQPLNEVESLAPLSVEALGPLTTEVQNARRVFGERSFEHAETLRQLLPKLIDYPEHAEEIQKQLSRIDATDTKICPACGEAIKRTAVVCRACGSEFTDAGPVPSLQLPSGEEKPKTKKSIVVAVLLTLLIGCTGAQRFYLDDRKCGAILLATCLGGWLLVQVFVGWLFIMANTVWWLYDIFTVVGRVKKYNAQLT